MVLEYHMLRVVLLICRPERPELQRAVLTLSNQSIWRLVHQDLHPFTGFDPVGGGLTILQWVLYSLYVDWHRQAKPGKSAVHVTTSIAPAFLMEAAFVTQQLNVSPPNPKSFQL